MTVTTLVPAATEPSRARCPDEAGHVERDGVRVGYEVYGHGERTLLLLPSWSIVHSRHWKGQIPYFARHLRVVAFDGRGNGRSDRPADAAAYADAEFVADAVAVLDATGTRRAAVAAFSAGADWALLLAALHPERVTHLALIGAGHPDVPHPDRVGHSFDAPLPGDGRPEGWAKRTRAWWQVDYPDFVEFFMGRMFTEPHSTKQTEDAVGWALETDPETLASTVGRPGAIGTGADVRTLADRIRCPVILIHGEDDAITAHECSIRLARTLDAPLLTMAGSGHAPHVRDPVEVNLTLRDFVDPPPPPDGTWTRARSRPRRALYISSPIGLGHAQRDVAIARELRRLVPGLEIDWLAQDPVTRVLEQAGERIHPLSAELANESQHMQAESREHELHCFQAWRRMDEILLANFMVFHDLVREERYDLWIGDEAWELDYYLHENPEEKRAAYAWLTDFVGWLPMPEGGEREAALTADYNAEMIGHIARFPRVRDRAVFIGAPDDIVPDDFGPGLPAIRDWTEDNYVFSGGYIAASTPLEADGRAELREELGYRPDEKVCVVTVGGSGVGGALLRRVIDSFDAARELVPSLRMVAVAGPRIDPRSLPRRPGLDVRAYVPELHRHLAACDLAVVQGGLTTCMELTASGRPFLYFPLRLHFEQNFHVRHRLDRHGAGRRMDFDDSPPDVIARAIAEEIGREVSYRPVESDSAARAAAYLAELL